MIDIASCYDQPIQTDKRLVENPGQSTGCVLLTVCTLISNYKSASAAFTPLAGGV